MLRGLFGAIIEHIQGFDEFGAKLRRKAGVKTLLAPGRAGFVDGEIQLPGDFDERVLVGGMQPAAAEVEGDIRGGENGAAPAPTMATST
jgi:hypothetical protein